MTKFIFTKICAFYCMYLNKKEKNVNYYSPVYPKQGRLKNRQTKQNNTRLRYREQTDGCQRRRRLGGGKMGEGFQEVQSPQHKVSHEDIL